MCVHARVLTTNWIGRIGNLVNDMGRIAQSVNPPSQISSGSQTAVREPRGVCEMIAGDGLEKNLLGEFISITLLNFKHLDRHYFRTKDVIDV